MKTRLRAKKEDSSLPIHPKSSKVCVELDKAEVQKDLQQLLITLSASTRKAGTYTQVPTPSLQLAVASRTLSTHILRLRRCLR